MEEHILSLAEAQGAKAEVFASEENRTTVKFRANEFHSQENRLTRGHGLRVVKNGRVGFSSSSDPNKVGELVQAALDTAQFGKQCGFEFPGAEPIPTVKTFENRVIALPALKMIEWGRELVDAVRARVPAIKVDVSLTRTYGERAIANSAGLRRRFARATLELSVTGLIVSDGLVWISEYENLSAGGAPSIGSLADRIEKKAVLARARARLATGTYPVIFMPTAVPNLLFPLVTGAGGKQLEKGSSPLIGKVGQKLLDEKIVLADNGLRDFGIASAPSDGEGVPRRRNVLFDRGVFTGFLFDLATAAACGARTTGSAARDYSSQPQPGISNIELAPGGASPEDVLAGDVAVNVSSGFRIGNGELSGRVKDTMVAGNVYEMLANVAAVGDTVRDLSRFHVPLLMFEGLKVATRD